MYHRGQIVPNLIFAPRGTNLMVASLTERLACHQLYTSRRKHLKWSWIFALSVESLLWRRILTLVVGYPSIVTVNYLCLSRCYSCMHFLMQLVNGDWGQHQLIWPSLDDGFHHVFWPWFSCESETSFHGVLQLCWGGGMFEGESWWAHFVSIWDGIIPCEGYGECDVPFVFPPVMSSCCLL